MTRRRSDIIRKVISIGIIVMAALAITFGVLWNRDITPNVTFLNGPPATVTLGERIPVTINVLLPWRRSIDDVAASVTGDFHIVSQDCSVASIGPGYTVWKCALNVISTETGDLHEGVLSITVDGQTSEFKLGPSKVAGLLGEGEEFMPVMSDYSPDTAPFPYALVGAVFFGILAGAGILIVLRPKPKKTEPLTIGEQLSGALLQLGEEAGLATAERHQRISDEVRAYLAEVWNLPAETSSKDQLLSSVESNAAMPADVRQGVRDYLEAADRAKYAPPGEQVDVSDHLNKALELLNVSEASRPKEVVDA